MTAPGLAPPRRAHRRARSRRAGSSSSAPWPRWPPTLTSRRSCSSPTTSTRSRRASPTRCCCARAASSPPGPSTTSITDDHLSECFDLPSAARSERAGSRPGRADQLEQASPALHDLVGQQPFEHGTPERPVVPQHHVEPAAGRRWARRRPAAPTRRAGGRPAPGARRRPARRPRTASAPCAAASSGRTGRCGHADRPTTPGAREANALGPGDDREPRRVAGQVVHPGEQLAGRARGFELGGQLHGASIAPAEALTRAGRRCCCRSCRSCRWCRCSGYGERGGEDGRACRAGEGASQQRCARLEDRVDGTRVVRRRGRQRPRSVASRAARRRGRRGWDEWRRQRRLHGRLRGRGPASSKPLKATRFSGRPGGGSHGLGSAPRASTSGGGWRRRRRLARRAQDNRPGRGWRRWLRARAWTGAEELGDHDAAVVEPPAARRR